MRREKESKFIRVPLPNIGVGVMAGNELHTVGDKASGLAAGVRKAP
jgi:hypothetical protein